MDKTTEQLNKTDLEDRRPPVMWQVIEMRAGNSHVVKTVKFPDLTPAEGANYDKQQTT